MKSRTLVAVLGALGFACQSPDVAVGDPQDITPSSAWNTYDQVAVCAKTLDRHAGIRDQDLKAGVVRWSCGDVPGVTSPDLGQEYCEYHAVSEGRSVATARELKPDAPLTCVFTSLFTNMWGSDKQTALSTSLMSAENLASQSIEPAITVMRFSFNSRGAATGLIDDCAGYNSSDAEELRQTACWQAAAARGADGAQLADLCRGQSLDSEERWAKVQALGAKLLSEGEPGFEIQNDLAACAKSRGKGVGWRNSDPTICARAYRAGNECDCSYQGVPSEVDGFAFTSWAVDTLPVGCRFAKLDGVDYKQLVLCSVTDSEREDLAINPQFSGNLQEFCHQRYANDLIMQAPLRAIQTPNSCQPKNAFCKAYLGQVGQE